MKYLLTEEGANYVGGVLGGSLTPSKLFSRNLAKGEAAFTVDSEDIPKDTLGSHVFLFINTHYVEVEDIVYCSSDHLRLLELIKSYAENVEFEYELFIDKDYVVLVNKTDNIKYEVKEVLTTYSIKVNGVSVGSVTASIDLLTTLGIFTN